MALSRGPTSGPTVGFGRVFRPDPRDRNYLIRLKKSVRTSRYWSDKLWFGDQGTESSCVGFAWSHWLVNSPLTQYVDPNGLYRVAQFLDEYQGEDYEGTSVRAGAKVLQALGFISEYRWTWELKPMISTLLEVSPVVIGVNWYEGMMKADASGLLHVTGSVVGGHAILVNGVNTKQKKFRLKNSWGKNWSLAGRAFLDFDDMDRLIGEDGEVCLAVEAKPAW